jgi:hypothetical protein
MVFPQSNLAVTNGRKGSLREQWIGGEVELVEAEVQTSRVVCIAAMAKVTKRAATRTWSGISYPVWPVNCSLFNHPVDAICGSNHCHAKATVSYAVSPPFEGAALA